MPTSDRARTELQEQSRIRSDWLALWGTPPYSRNAPGHEERMRRYAAAVERGDELPTFVVERDERDEREAA